jgi:hypothetical protein
MKQVYRWTFLWEDTWHRRGVDKVQYSVVATTEECARSALGLPDDVRPVELVRLELWDIGHSQWELLFGEPQLDHER